MPCFFSTTTLPSVPCSMQSSEKILSKGGVQKPPEAEDISGAAQSLWLFFMTFLLLVSHLCGSPLGTRQWHVLIVSASSKCWFTSSHHGLSACPYITHLFNRLPSTLPACHNSSGQHPRPIPSAFLVSQNSGTAHLLCIISFIRLTGHVIGLPSLHGELSEVLFITGNPYCNSSIWLQMV